MHIEVHSALDGASVHGLDASLPLTDSQLQALQSALHEHHVLLLYGQHLEDAQLARFMRNLIDACCPDEAATSLLYAEAVPRTGSDAVWIQLASACDLIDAGTKCEPGELQVIAYNTFLRRLRRLPACG